MNTGNRLQNKNSLITIYICLFSLIAVYTLINQTLLFKYQVINLPGLYSDYILPAILALIIPLVSFGLAGSFRLLKSLYIIIIILFIVCSTVLLQPGLHMYFDSKQIINLPSVNEIGRHPFDYNFLISNYTLSGNYYSYKFQAWHGGGKNPRYLELGYYFTVPFNNTENVYLGSSYHAYLNPPLNHDEVKSFYDNALDDFIKTNLLESLYFYKIKNLSDKLYYIQSLNDPDLKNPVLLIGTNYSMLENGTGYIQTVFTVLLAMWLVFSIYMLGAAIFSPKNQ